MREVNDITQDIINLGENIKELTKKQKVLVSLLCMERQKTNLLTRELEWMKSSAIGDFGAVILREVETIITSGQSCKCCLLAGRETNDDIVSTDEPFFDDSKSTDLVDHNESPEVVENEEIGYNLNVELKDESNLNEEPSVRTTTYVGSSDDVNHEYSFIRNNISKTSPVRIRSCNSVSAISSIGDVEFSAQMDDTAESVESGFSDNAYEAHEVPTVHYEIDEGSLNRFDLKVKRMTVKQLFKKLKRSCKSCNFKTKSKKKLRNHVASEHQDVIFFCSNCNFHTKSKPFLKQHVKAEHENFRYSCKSCSYQCKYKSNMQRHKCKYKSIKVLNSPLPSKCFRV